MPDRQLRNKCREGFLIWLITNKVLIQNVEGQWAIMGVAKGLHENNRRRMFHNKLMELWSSKLLSKFYLTRHRRPVKLKDTLCQIDSGHHINCYDCPSYLFVTFNVIIRTQFKLSGNQSIYSSIVTAAVLITLVGS